MKVHWTDNAVAQLAAIHEYIAMDSKLYADRVVDRLTRKSQRISTMPRSRRMVPEYEQPDVREVIIRPYRVIYRVKPDQIDVLSVVDGAQRLPDEVQE